MNMAGIATALRLSDASKVSHHRQSTAVARASAFSTPNQGGDAKERNDEWTCFSRRQIVYRGRLPFDCRGD